MIGNGWQRSYGFDPLYSPRSPGRQASDLTGACIALFPRPAEFIGQAAISRNLAFGGIALFHQCLVGQVGHVPIFNGWLRAIPARLQADAEHHARNREQAFPPKF